MDINRLKSLFNTPGYIQPLESFNHFWAFIDQFQWVEADVVLWLSCGCDNVSTNDKNEKWNGMIQNDSNSSNFPIQENVIHTELEIKLSQSFPTIPNFCSHFHPYVWRQLTNALFFFRAKTPHLPCDGWDCCQGRKSIGQPMNKTDNFIFWMTFSKIVVKSHITASPGREG